jgi:hypothetical protein
MGVLGRYIDSLSDAARDRVIEAQIWCAGDVLASRGEGRCLLGHAEDWVPLAVQATVWQRWMDGETGGAELARAVGSPAPAGLPGYFAFRRAYPVDMGAYLARMERWGIRSEGRIGAHFDRLCARAGTAEAVRRLKARAARGGLSLPPRACGGCSTPQYQEGE